MSETNKISQFQLFSLGSCYLMGTILSSVFINVVAANDSWVIGIMGALVFLPVMFIYLALSKKYPGMNLFDINEAVYGRVIGKLVSALYLFFFLTVCALNAMEAENFISCFVMPGTPMFLTSIFMMAACAYCVKKGIFPLARVSSIFGIFAFIIICLNFFLSFQNFNFDYLTPAFNKPPLDYIQSTHIALSIPYGESIFLLMLLPELSEKGSLKKTYISIVFFTMFIMVIVHLREIASLGPLVSFAVLPSYEAVRMISFANSIARTESLFALLLTSLTFFKVMLTFYVCARGTMQLFGLRGFRHITIMLALFMTIYSVKLFSPPVNEVYWGINVIPIVWCVFVLILPLLTLLASFAKKLILPNNKQNTAIRNGG